jgi:hypothetical protein
MAALDWSQCDAVESIPGKVGGAWVFRDTRLPVATVIENLEDLSVEEVMNAAEEAAIDLLLTTDRRIRYQQNLAGRRIALVVLTGTTKWARVRLHLERVAAVVDAATPGRYTEVEIPFK